MDFLVFLLILLVAVALFGGYFVGHVLYWLLIIAAIIFIVRMFSGTGGRRY